MGKVIQEMIPVVFGALLLITLCHPARLPGSNDKELKLDTKNKAGSNLWWRGGRCLDTVRKWFGAKDDILSGDPNDVRFFLYPSPLDKTYAEEVKYGNVSALKEVHLLAGVPLKIVVHGFTKSHMHKAMQIIKDAYLIRMQHSPADYAVNIVLVDWEPLGNPKVEVGDGLFYNLAVENVPVVGKRVGQFVQFLMKNRIVQSLRDVHLIGFSLGAHVVGNAGNELRGLNAGRVPARVTGLDPAGPFFYENLKTSHRSLHKMDGRFVDVIHTNMGAMGTLNAIGHADFFPNGGGPIQLRCEMEYEQNKHVHGNSNDEGIWDSKLLSITSCSHNKAPEYFAVSILNQYMVACKCQSYLEFKSRECSCNETALFGEYCDSRARGTFFLDI